MKYAIYTDTPGPILYTIICGADQIASQASVGQSYLEIDNDVDDASHYIDSTPSAVAYPEKPFDYYEFDFVTEDWINPRSLDDAKILAWAALEVARDGVIYAPLDTPHGRFKADLRGQLNIMGAIQASDKIVQLALPSPEPAEASVTFVLLDNSQVTLNNAELGAVGLMLAARIEAIYEYASNLLTEVGECTTEEELAALAWAFDEPTFTPTVASATAAARSRIAAGLAAANAEQIEYSSIFFPMHLAMQAQLSAWATEAFMSLQASESSFVNTVTGVDQATYELDQADTIALFRAHQARNRVLAAHAATLQADVAAAAAITPEEDAITALDAIVWSAP